MPMTGKDRAALRAEAHHLSPMVHVGHQGLTPAVFKSLDDALRTHELVKISLARTTEVPPRTPPTRSPPRRWPRSSR
jgi:RNA-binding protein